MSNLTLRINLSELTVTQLAALHVVMLAGCAAGGKERRRAFGAIDAAGKANCGDKYPPEFKRVSDFLLNLDKGEV